MGEAAAQQGDVNWEWAFHDLDYKSFDLSIEEKRRMNEREREFVLLLQVDFMDDHTDFSDYGGSGTAYFGISKEDLKNKKFENAILVCQTT